MKDVRTSQLLMMTALVAVWVSCDPQNIAPLPSPTEPDGTRVLLSSLTATESDDTDANYLISVVGIPGAVENLGTVEITNTRNGLIHVATATEAGTFAGKSYGQAGDSLELVYIDNDGYRSAVTDLVVASYVRLDTNASGTPAEPETSQPPTPGEDFEVGGGNDANSGCDENEEDCIDRPTEEPQVDEVGWVVS